MNFHSIDEEDPKKISLGLLAEEQFKARSSSVLLIARMGNADTAPSGARGYALGLFVPNRGLVDHTLFKVPERMIFRWVGKRPNGTYEVNVSARLYGREALDQRTASMPPRSQVWGLVHFVVWDVSPQELMNADCIYVLHFTDLDGKKLTSPQFVGRAKIVPHQTTRQFPGITMEHRFGE